MLKDLRYRGETTILDIENLRKILNEIVETNNCTSTEVLTVSQKMDELILKYMSQNSKRD